MLIEYLRLLFIGFFLKFHTIFSDEDCQVSQKPKLQIVFVVNKVASHFNGEAHFQNMTALHLIDYIKQNNFQAEYAVAGFLDYPTPAAPREITNPELCYFLMQEFITDKDKTVAAVTKNLFPQQTTNWSNYYPGPDLRDSLTTAMLFAAVDKRLHWNSGFYDNQGNLVRKIMIPMVHRDFTRTLVNPGNRKPPKADGTDTCATALIPELEQLNQVLWDNQFTVVNIILNNRNTSFDALYEKEFASLLVPYYQAACPRAGASLNPPYTFDYESYAKRVYDIIMQEVMSCDWEDPIGYNSLGL